MSKDLKCRLVFHGTQKPAGTNSNTIHQPSLLNPFFVGSTPEIALSYVNSSGSIFILSLKDDPDKIALNLSKIKSIKKLSSKLPKTVNAMNYWMEGAGYVLGSGRPTFWGYIQYLINLLSFISKNNQIPKDNNEYDDSKLVDLSIEMLTELKFLKVNENSILIDDKTLEENVKKAVETFSVGTNIYRRKAGRIIKEPINKAAYSLGYYMVGDRDTGIEDSDDNEYAIFDKSVFDKALNVSVPIDEVKKGINYFMKDKYYVVKKIPDNVDLAVTDLLKKKTNGIMDEKSIPKHWRIKLKHLVIPNNIHTMKERDTGDLLTGCYNLESVIIPNSVKQFECSPFVFTMGNVKEISLGDGLDVAGFPHDYSSENRKHFSLIGINNEATIIVGKSFNKEILKKLVDDLTKYEKEAKETLKIKVI